MTVDRTTLPREIKPRSRSSAAWRRFSRQPGALLGLLITALLVVICFFAPYRRTGCAGVGTMTCWDLLAHGAPHRP
ncbi:hypothetical protein [Deinococcus planocerae]|uniref:hypothetical protein n=1 Tax=Deinococcus planocerae TaxID=1737569 RepID=UPI001FED0E86|nr:hypothetical protein [Deinococcus planocerae]